MSSLNLKVAFDPSKDNEEYIISLLKKRTLELTKLYLLAREVVKHGRIKVVEYMLSELKMRVSDDMIEGAVEYNHLDILQLFEQYNAKWPFSAYYHASKNGNMVILDWLVKRLNKARGNSDECKRYIALGASVGGHLTILKEYISYCAGREVFNTITHCNVECLVCLHESGVLCELYNYRAPFTILSPRKEEVDKYKRLHSLNKINCPACIKERLWNDWKLESYNYNSYVQWFPGEVLEDIVALF